MEKLRITKKTWQERKAETSRMLIKYPERVCVRIERVHSETILPDIKKQKYLVPHHINIGQLNYIIRQQIKIDSKVAMFFFINKNIIPTNNSLIKDLYDKYADDDGFLYIRYATENTFG